VVADLVGWRVSLHVPGTRTPLDVVIADAGERPGGDEHVLILDPQAPGDIVELGPELGCELQWAALGGRQRARGTVAGPLATSPDQWELHVAWPPQLIQQRLYHRANLELEVAVATLEDGPASACSRTLDVSAGGVAMEPPGDVGLAEGHHVALAMDLPERPVIATARIIQCSPDRVRVGFEQITTGDQDRIARLVNQAEKGR
jgi:hypothetical protein